MKENKEQNPQKSKKQLLGIGLDNSDGHTRYTRGENFHIAGGSEETHEKMTETAIKFNEKLAKKGKTLDDISHKEFIDILNDSIVK